jgi:signal transduction histidine kinase
MSQIQTTLDADRSGHSADSVAIVHDLGNLIQIASSAINIVARYPGIRGAGLEPVLTGAKTSLERAGALVRQTIGLATAQSPEEQHVDLATVIAELATLIHITWDQSVQLDIDVPPDLPFVTCNALGLQNAVLNILFNARQAMPDGGVIRIRTGSIDLESSAGIELRIVDSGVGMKPDTIARAFHPFFTTRCDGLGGVGLTMVERFARDAGGCVLIESQYGIGTTVRLQLPTSPTNQGLASQFDNSTAPASKPLSSAEKSPTHP